ncbi:MAG: ACP S-malonyltransferase [Candidatus Neomarinimicrobiota bacterium]|nr:ACP S-malonyltransferase [Candidatus Neomarinimicrobiota bacterium]
MKERIAVICPGRGGYTRDTQGYLARGDLGDDLVRLDAQRRGNGLPTLSELDNSPFHASTHLPGEHASVLIYACGLMDFLSIDRDRYEIVAITGNSMGWYTALGLGGALADGRDYTLLQTMGAMMKDGLVGGQLITPLVDSEWRRDPERERLLDEALESAGKSVYYSIRYGGYAVIGGEEKGLNELEKMLPSIDDDPFRIPYNGAFHTPLMAEISSCAFDLLPETLFRQPSVPLIDGRGTVWRPHSASITALRDYTLGYQVTETFDFSAAVAVMVKEFCTDRVVLLGPGNPLGGAVGHVLIQENWLDIDSKTSFLNRQAEDPFVISMGIPEQRRLVTA